MNTFERTIPMTPWIHRVTSLACAGMLTLGACVTEEETASLEFRSVSGDEAIEDPEPPAGPNPVEDEGQDAGVEGPLTITPAGVSQLLASGGVELQLQQQALLGHVGPSITSQPEPKIEAVTGEPIIVSGMVEGELVGATASFEFRASPERDHLYIVNRSKHFGDVPAPAIVPAQVIEQQAQADLLALGISLDPAQTLVVDEMMRAPSSDPTQAEPVAYKVFVDLELGGHRVAGPRVILSYYLDGELHKVSARWPEVVGSAPSSLSPWSNVEALVYGALATHPLGAETHPLSAEARLTIVDGFLRQEVVIRGLLSAGPGGGPIFGEDTGRIGELNILIPEEIPDLPPPG